MDLTYEEYVNYINHLFLQEYVDFDYHDSDTTSDALAIFSPN